MNKNQENGRSMIEMLGVLAIIGVLSVGALAGYQRMISKYNIGKNIQIITDIINSTKMAYSNLEDYEGLNNETAIAANIFPDILFPQKNLSDTDKAKNVVSPYSGKINMFASPKRDVTAYPDEQVASVVLEIGNISKDMCMGLATAGWDVGVKTGLIAVITSGENGRIAKTNMEEPQTDAGGKNNKFGADLVYWLDDNNYPATNTKYAKFGIAVNGNTHGYNFPMNAANAARGCQCLDSDKNDNGDCAIAIKFY